MIVWLVRAWTRIDRFLSGWSFGTVIGGGVARVACRPVFFVVCRFARLCEVLAVRHILSYSSM